MSNQPPAILLLSGGLDSAVTLALARAEGYEPRALSIRYGQRHAHELAAAERVARSQGVTRHVVLDIDLARFGGSALTSSAIEVPKNRSETEIAAGIPSTYVPARNTIFLSLALAMAEVERASDIFLGVNAVDYSGYPDCRPEFLAAFERLAKLATKAGVEGTQTVRIHAPLIQMSKAQIIRRGLELGVDFSLTSSCYDPHPVTGAACGRCDSCQLRRKGFAQAGLADPIAYQSEAGPA